MPYTVNLTDGTEFAVIPDGTTNADSSLVLLGKNFPNYGEIMAEDLMALLENFAYDTAPTNPVLGQLWYDKTPGLETLKVWDGVNFKNISSTTAQATPPANGILGDLWFDTTNNQLNAYNGAAWMIIGPDYSVVDGISGQVVESIQDTPGLAYHVVVKNYVAGELIGITSNDPIFTPLIALAGFGTVGPGYTLRETDEGGLEDLFLTGAAIDPVKGSDIVNKDYVDVSIANSSSEITAAGPNGLLEASHGVLAWYGYTNNTTSTEIFVNGVNGTRFALNAAGATTFAMLVVSKDSLGNSNSWRLEGDTLNPGFITKTVLGTGTPGHDIALSVVSNTLRITVTQDASATDAHWAVRSEWVRVAV